MQALQMSGQAAEIMDSLPVRGPASGEVENSEHPFRKLLARLRNAMKQGEEPDKGSLEGVSKLNPDSFSKAKSMASPSGLIGTGLEKPEGDLSGDPGLQRNAGLAVRNAVSRNNDEAGQKAAPGLRESSPTNMKGRSSSFLLGGDATAAHGENRGLAGVSGADQGRGSGTLVAGALVQGTVPFDQDKQPGLGDNKQDSTNLRNSDSSAEALAKRRSIGAKGSLDGTTLAASGHLNSTMNAAGLNRNQNLGSSRDKGSLVTSGDEVRATGLRSSRYSVVDLRLKASTRKAGTDVLTEGKLEGKPGGSPAIELNRSGQAGTDAAGRQVGNDQPASGFTGISKGSGTETGDRAPASFADNLAARLRDGGSLDIVRSAQIVLKDGDAGLIRLRLEPESLGGVKIELKMADKQISAKIIVESDLAGEAFRSSLDSLRDAFSSSGFETTSIEVEVRNGQAGTGDASHGDTGYDGDGDSQGLYAARKAEELGDAVPSADAVYGRYGVIDLVV